MGRNYQHWALIVVADRNAPVTKNLCSAVAANGLAPVVVTGIEAALVELKERGSKRARGRWQLIVSESILMDGTVTMLYDRLDSMGGGSSAGRQLPIVVASGGLSPIEIELVRRRWFAAVMMGCETAAEMGQQLRRVLPTSVPLQAAS
jgi:hypothetical protein